MSTPKHTLTIDFQKEREIQKISQLLRAWPAEIISFLLDGLEHPPQAVKASFEQYYGHFRNVPILNRKQFS